MSPDTLFLSNAVILLLVILEMVNLTTTIYSRFKPKESAEKLVADLELRLSEKYASRETLATWKLHVVDQITNELRNKLAIDYARISDLSQLEASTDKRLSGMHTSLSEQRRTNQEFMVDVSRTVGKLEGSS